jgi:2-keto-3-deoxy-L-rhamnonate aldolase RhmA
MAGHGGIGNAALARMRAGEAALGMIVRLARSGEIAMIAATTGHDFIFIDGQHGIFDKETIAHIALAALGAGVAPVVRVRGYDDADIPQLLDAGVLGIVVPDVNTPAEAARAVEAAKFPPLGRRSVQGSYLNFGFRPVPIGEATAALNAETMLVCMIESRQALANLDEIAKVDGVDVLHIGCNDLLVDMGLPGAFGCPEIMTVLERLIEVCRANGKFAGVGGDRDIGRQRRLIERGVRFITTQADSAFLMAEAERRTKALRGG